MWILIEMNMTFRLGRDKRERPKPGPNLSKCEKLTAKARGQGGNFQKETLTDDTNVLGIYFMCCIHSTCQEKYLIKINVSLKSFFKFLKAPEKIIS